MAEEASAAPEQRNMLESERDYEAAIDQVIAAAEGVLRIFDVDLRSGAYFSVRRHQLLSDFLRRSGRNRLTIVLHDTAYLTGYCPRLMNLLTMHSHALAIHKTEDHARVAHDPFVLADDLHYVHRFHRDGPRSLLAMNDPVGTRQLSDRFDELLDASHPAVFATTLGL